MMVSNTTNESYDEQREREYVEAVTGAHLGPGKTLRDEYAMAALTGLLVSGSVGIYEGKRTGGTLIETAFQLADEALKQRGEP